MPPDTISIFESGHGFALLYDFAISPAAYDAARRRAGALADMTLAREIFQEATMLLGRAMHAIRPPPRSRVIIR